MWDAPHLMGRDVGWGDPSEAWGEGLRQTRQGTFRKMSVEDTS